MVDGEGTGSNARMVSSGGLLQTPGARKSDERNSRNIKD